MLEMEMALSVMRSEYQKALDVALRSSPVRVLVVTPCDNDGQKTGRFEAFVTGGTNEQNLAARIIAVKTLRGMTNSCLRRLGRRGKATWWTTDSHSGAAVDRERALFWQEDMN